jgi:hypothetical protein
MTTLRRLAAVAFALALLCGSALKQFALGWAVAVTPSRHADVISATLGLVLFCVLLLLSMIMICASLLREIRT